MTQFGVTIPNNWGVSDPIEVLTLGSEAEQQGFDSIWVMDHLFNAGYIRERLDDKPYYHPMAMLSYLSATTSSVRLGTSVLVLPYHTRWNWQNTPPRWTRCRAAVSSWVWEPAL